MSTPESIQLRRTTGWFLENPIAVPPYFDAASMRREACHYIGQLRDLVENEQYQPSRNSFEASLFHSADAYKAVGLISLDEHAKILAGERM